jgi:hypothetical protein
MPGEKVIGSWLNERHRTGKPPRTDHLKPIDEEFWDETQG